LEISLEEGGGSHKYLIKTIGYSCKTMHQSISTAGIRTYRSYQKNKNSAASLTYGFTVMAWPLYISIQSSMFGYKPQQILSLVSLACPDTHHLLLGGDAGKGSSGLVAGWFGHQISQRQIYSTSRISCATGDTNLLIAGTGYIFYHTARWVYSTQVH